MATPTTNDFMNLLRVPEIADENKRLSRLLSRIVGLEHGEACSRCWGSGHYSFCPGYGTRCFKCGGAGSYAPKLTAKLFAALTEDVAAGKLDEYLANLTAKTLAKKAAKTATDRVMAAWKGSGVSEAYDWTKASGRDMNPVDEAISHEINLPMSKLYTKVSDLSSELDSIGYRVPKNTEERIAKEAEIATKRAALIVATDEAIAEINKLALLLPEYVARRNS